MLTAGGQIAACRPRPTRFALLAGALTLVVLALVAVGVASVARASVESGALSQLGEPASCIGETKEEVAKCGTKIAFGLDFAYELQVSPDGSSAYSVAVNGDLTEYSRDRADGALSVIGCVSSKPVAEPACEPPNAQMEVAAIESPAAVAISPDGRDVYVVTQGSVNGLVEFSRDPTTGLLTKIGCITHEASSSECATTGAKGLNLPYGVAVSPDGENVYVASFADEAVAEFKRDSETGMLTQLAGANNCISQTLASECGTTTAIGLHEAIGIVVSPDGKDVYVGAGARSATGDIAAFERGSEGALTQLSEPEGCIGEKVSGCTEGSQAQHIDGAEDIAISPDGHNLYATSYAANAVVELHRTASGALQELAVPNVCVSKEALANCTQAAAVGSTIGVAVSPDGKDLYTSSQESSVAAFARGGEGQLTQLGSYPCLTEAATGCLPASANERVGLQYARRLTVSPDGTNVYVAAQSGHDIAELARTVTPVVTSVNVVEGSPSGGETVRVKGLGFSEDAKGVKVMFGAQEAAAASVSTAGTILATSPAHSEGTVHVTVENEAGKSTELSSDDFTFTDRPTVLGVSAAIGAESGGTGVTITGAEFTGATAVRFGSTAASSFKVESSNFIVASAPPGVGTVDVVVETAHGASSTGPADKFTYVNGTPSGVSGLFLQGYCEGRGYKAVVLQRETEGGAGYAYENWACVAANGSETPIANVGEPSMQDACERENPGKTVYAYPGEPDNAYSWGCNVVIPPAKKSGEGETFTTPPPTHLASELVTPITPVGKPQLAKTGNVAPVEGTVLVQLPGAKAFVALTTLTQIPFGSIVEATHGKVSVTATEPNGSTETGVYFGGRFKLTQERNGTVVATLTGGSFSVCPTARERAHRASTGAGAHVAASGKHSVRKLWTNAHGKFSTRGNYAAGAVQGTEWLTNDLCEGTLIKVTRDKVAVTNLVNHKHVLVKAGHHYLAKAP